MITEIHRRTQATSFGVSDAPALGNQGTGEKSTTGQNTKLLTPKTTINIAAWNIRTGHRVGQKELIARELRECRIAITALSEVRMPGAGMTTVATPEQDSEMALYFSGEEIHEAVVAFMVDKQAV
ncbi:hypothetical protein, partial [Acinetobacter baumannii]|uniref:hypothetical protein n=1 Tax=Acinetobacter baumannii TaxID=470 RepID=UPI0033960A6A